MGSIRDQFKEPASGGFGAGGRDAASVSGSSASPKAGQKPGNRKVGLENRAELLASVL